MEKVFIVHGWEGSPQEPMLNWIAEQLKNKGFEVHALEMPNPDEPKINEWVPYLDKSVDSPGNNTFFIGHSIGCQAILRYLETLSDEIKIGGVILIAPWLHLDEQTIKEEGEEIVETAKPWIETPINWEKVKSHTNKFIALFSDNDKYVPLSDSEIFKEKLGAKIIVEHEKGHFDEAEGVIDNPIAIEELLKMSCQEPTTELDGVSGS